jgi:16S rRNA (guanine527-N7)-methyltransferase
VSPKKNSLIYSMLDLDAQCRQAAQEVLPVGFSALGLPISESQLDQFAQLAALLIVANRTVNLTAITDPDEIMRRHVLDSMTAAPILSQRGATNIVDVGTGGGFPGLALSVYQSHWRVTMIDSVGKKTAFVRRAADHLRLANVKVITARAEEAGAGENRECFDAALARALASTSAAIEYCAPLVRVGGLLLLYKSGDVTTAVADGERVASLVGCSPPAAHSVIDTLGVGSDRFLFEVTKERPTPPRFPRQPGQAKRHPL